MSELRAIDYAMSDADTNELKGTVQFPFDLRVLALTQYAEKYGTPAIVNLFAQFIGLANSVVANNREMIELLGIIEGGEHPYTAEKYNLPSIFGALCGVNLANSIDPNRACHGCAYRLGTCANQSPSTTCDADYAAADSFDFFCHERLDENDKPNTLCIGHALRKKDRVAA